jgi:hypothetical protein
VSSPIADAFPSPGTAIALPKGRWVSSLLGRRHIVASTGNQGVGQPNRIEEAVYGEMATTVKDKAQDVASAAEAAWGEMTGLMRRYPFGTLFVGIGMGFLLSRLLEDRGSRDFRRLGSDLYDRVRDYASDVASKLHA